MPEVIVTDEFKGALKLLEDRHVNVFVTGKAGTGKSTLLECFRQKSTASMCVLAPTGVSALNVNGETIHSFFKFSPAITPEQAQKKGFYARESALYRVLTTLLIDEVSMLRADLLDCMDLFLKQARGNDNPFGGVQVIFFGDLFQLPPVLRREDREAFYDCYDSEFFFSSHVMKDLALTIFELKTVHRQKEDTFVTLLNAVRHGVLTQPQLKALNARVMYDFPKEDRDVQRMTLCATNKRADVINRAQLAAIDRPLFQYSADISGEFNIHSTLARHDLVLKEEAQVMFLNNDNEGRWVNGSFGKVVFLDEDMIFVQLTSGERVSVSTFKWKVYKYILKKGVLSQEKIGSFTQYPLTLAWAMTIHKSQGKTFDSLWVDMKGGAFAHGQVYVALSRCRSLSGLRLITPLRSRDIITDPRVLDFQSQVNLENTVE